MVRCEKGAFWSTALALLPAHPSVVHLNSLASALAKGHRWRQALWLLRAPGAEATTFNAVMAACAGAEEWRWSLRIFERMSRWGLWRRASKRV